MGQLVARVREAEERLAGLARALQSAWEEELAEAKTAREAAALARARAEAMEEAAGALGRDELASRLHELALQLGTSEDTARKRIDELSAVHERIEARLTAPPAAPGLPARPGTERTPSPAPPPPAETARTDAPKAEPPKAEAPKAEPPKAHPPKAEPPKAEAPKAEPPKAEAPKAEPPKAEAPKVEAPKTEPPKTEAARAEVLQAQTLPPQPEARPAASAPPARSEPTPTQPLPEPPPLVRAAPPKTPPGHEPARPLPPRAPGSGLQELAARLDQLDERVQQIARLATRVPAAELLETLREHVALARLLAARFDALGVDGFARVGPALARLGTLAGPGAGEIAGLQRDEKADWAGLAARARARRQELLSARAKPGHS